MPAFPQGNLTAQTYLWGCVDLNPPLSLSLFFFKILFIYLFIFREGERKEKEGERNINEWLSLACPLLGTFPATQACVLTGN